MAKEKEELPLGYVVPFHRSLTQPMLWMGVPRNLLVVEFLIAVVGGVIFKTFMVVGLAAAIHILFRYLAHKDPQFHEVFLRSLRHKLYYEV